MRAGYKRGVGMSIVVIIWIAAMFWVAMRSSLLKKCKVCFLNFKEWTEDAAKS
jgi:hypothetical protein